MATTRTVDGKGRVVLPAGFAGQTVSVRDMGGGEVRVKLVRRPLRRPSLESLLGQITDENRHDEVDFGRAAGGELL